MYFRLFTIGLLLGQIPSQVVHARDKERDDGETRSDLNGKTT
jgi:hypothetical protein